MIEDKMKALTNAICESLESEPHNWVFKPCTCKHKQGKFAGKDFWVDTSDRVFEIWNGRTTHSVFDADQTQELIKSYVKGRGMVVNSLQQELVSSIDADDNSCAGGKQKESTLKYDLMSLIEKHKVKRIKLNESFFLSDSIEFSVESGDDISIRVDDIV